MSLKNTQTVERNIAAAIHIINNTKTGIFGKSSINPVAKWDGLVYGEWRLFVAQIEGILITIVIAVVGTLICVAIVRIFTTLRVTDREERIGLDISQHGENAYPSFNGMDQ